MTPKQAIEAFIQSVIQIEVQKVLPVVVKLVPGVAGSLLSSALSLHVVQEKIAAAETWAADEAVDELAKGITEITAFVQFHVTGELKKVVDAVQSFQVPDLHLDATKIRVLAAAATAGKLDGFISALAKDLGLAPAAP